MGVEIGLNERSVSVIFLDLVVRRTSLGECSTSSSQQRKIFGLRGN